MSLIFDSHLDLAWNALTWKRDLRMSLSELNASEAQLDDAKFRGRATTTLSEMRRGKIAVCLGTMMGRVPYGDAALHGSTLDFSSHQQVYAFARGQFGYYEALEQSGDIRLIRSKQDLQSHWESWKQIAEDSDASEESESGSELSSASVLESDSTSTLNPKPIGLILAMEGADAIISPAQVSHWYELGLRCASLVHYGTSAYAVGTGDEGPLTESGKQLLAEFESTGMILDTTHLCDTSFFEAIERFNGPVCASHQACRSLIPGQRQFSDEQIRIIIQRGGVLGVPCDAWMLYPNWERGETNRSVIGIEVLADHIDHVCQLAGNSQHISIGSDLDGGFGSEQTPTGLDSIADLQKLVGILTTRGYSTDDVDALMGENWLRFFGEHLPSD